MLLVTIIYDLCFGRIILGLMGGVSTDHLLMSKFPLCIQTERKPFWLTGDWSRVCCCEYCIQGEPFSARLLSQPTCWVGFQPLSKYRQSNCHQVPHLLAVCPIHLLRTPSTANLFNNETGHGFSNELLINRFNDLTKLEASRWRRSQIQIQMQTFTAAANPKTVLGRFNTKTSTNFCRFLTNWSDSTQWICIFNKYSKLNNQLI